MDDDTLKRMSVTISLPANRKTKWLLPGRAANQRYRAGFLPPCRKVTGEIRCWQEEKNSFQTNGVLLDDKWCAFLAENHFLVGLSLDGPAEIHNQYRVTKVADQRISW